LGYMEMWLSKIGRRSGRMSWADGFLERDITGQVGIVFLIRDIIQWFE
jgi:hypothetical protein